jgi:hypothetical protein
MTVLQVAYQSNNANKGPVESGYQPHDTETQIHRLRALPPGPTRSLGGYLDYSGWPDQQRFLELDMALQRQAQENNNPAADVEPTETLPPLRQCTARVGEGTRCRNKFRPGDDYSGTKCEEHRSQHPFMEVITAPEDLPLRRL